MNGKVLLLPVVLAAILALAACGGEGVPPGSGGTTAVGGGALSVQLTQGPPASMAAGSSVGLFATVFNDKNNAGVTWSCAPAGACGTFSPTTTGYLVDTLYTAPILANGPVTPNLNHAITITATSVTDSSQSATSASINLTQQYAIVLYPGNGSFGMVASVTLDGNGNVISGEADGSANGLYWSAPSVTGTYALDATGHGNISLSLNNSTCCGTLQQTHGITATSNSHLIIAEEDNFNGLTIGAVGSMDLQAAAIGFSGTQVAGGYSFTLAGYSHELGQNGSWGGIFAADGTALGSTPGNITGGIFDENVGNNGGGTGYNAGLTTPAAGLPFTGTYTAPDADGRGVITLSSSPDVPGPCGSTPLPACTQYVYYLVTPEVLQLTSMTNVGSAANTGTAFGQGSLATAAADTTALSGGFVFSYYGFGDNNNGGDSDAAAGQFATDGGGNVTTGIMDLNVANGGSPTPSIATNGISLAGSTYAISGSARGTLTTPSGQNYNVYLTDPNLNLLDPNNTTGGGGALLLEADNPSVPYGNAVGVVIPQADPASAALSGRNAVLLSNQSNLGGCCNYDGGLTGDFTVTSGTFSGEADFQGTGANSATLTTGPLSGTFSADVSNPGHFTGTITTTPSFPYGIGGTTPGTESVDYFMANGSQGFIIETDTLAPIFGAVELQGTITGAAAAKRPRAQTKHSHPKNLLQVLGEQHSRPDSHSINGQQ